MMRSLAARVMPRPRTKLSRLFLYSLVLRNQSFRRRELRAKQKAASIRKGNAAAAGRRRPPRPGPDRYSQESRKKASFCSLQFFLFAFCLNHMPCCRNRMVQQHVGPGPTHHSTNLFPHIRTVAVYAAVGAEGFCLHERTSVAALPRIFGQRGAFGAQAFLASVLFAAVQRHHFLYHTLFPLPLALNALQAGHQLNRPSWRGVYLVGQRPLWMPGVRPAQRCGRRVRFAATGE